MWSSPSSFWCAFIGLSIRKRFFVLLSFCCLLFHFTIDRRVLSCMPSHYRWNSLFECCSDILSLKLYSKCYCPSIGFVWWHSAVYSHNPYGVWGITKFVWRIVVVIVAARINNNITRRKNQRPKAIKCPVLIIMNNDGDTNNVSKRVESPFRYYHIFLQCSVFINAVVLNKLVPNNEQ